MTYLPFDSIVDRFRYPAGETHLRLRSEAAAPVDDDMVIEVRATGFETLGEILTADRLLRRRDAHVTWFVPYFPFARHDRRMDRDDGLELEVALDLVRPLQIAIADPHSDVAGLLSHLAQADNVAAFRRHGLFDGDPMIVIPDSGATKKADTWRGAGDVIQATKHRNPSTGRLSRFAIPEVDLAGRPCVIVDDICDGGGTFLGLAKELRNANAGPLRLGVTHGLFTKGTDELTIWFDDIVTFAFAGEPPPVGVDAIPFRDLYERGTVR